MVFKMLLKEYLVKLKFLTALFLITLLVKDFNAQLSAPTKLGNCKARLDDKSIIDLTSLDDVKNPR